MPALANIELIWVIIIIGSVIAQLIKGAKKVASQAPGKSPGAGEANATSQADNKQGEFVASEDALQDFLQSLGGEKPKPKPKPKPLQKPAITGKAVTAANKNPARQTSAQRATAKRVARAKPAPKRQPSPMRPKRKPLRAMDPKRQFYTDEVKLEKVTEHETSKGVLGRTIKEDVKNEDSIRKAIVMREVLGPPVALRG